MTFNIHVDNAKYDCSDNSDSDPNVLRTAINDINNWEFNNGQPYSFPICEISCVDIAPSIVCPNDTIVNVSPRLCSANFEYVSSMFSKL